MSDSESHVWLFAIVHGILQARILEWVAYAFTRESSQLRNLTGVSWIAGEFFINWATKEAWYVRQMADKRKTITVGFHLYMETKSTALIDTDRMLVARSEGWEKFEGVDQGV